MKFKLIQLLFIINIIAAFFLNINSKCASMAVLFELSFILLAFFYCSTNHLKNNQKVIFNILKICLCLLFLFYINRGYYTGIGSIIALFNFIFQYIIVLSSDISNRIYKKIYYLFLIGLLLYPCYLSSTLNPNILSFVFFSYGVIASLFLKNSIRHIIILVGIGLFSIIGIWLNGSRTITVAFCLYLFIRFLPIKLIKLKLFYFIIIVFFTLGSLVYVGVYELASIDGWDVSEIQDISGSSKNIFSGRQHIWFEAITNLMSHPITGMGSNITLDSFRIVNLHNSIFNFFVIYGIPIGILMVIIIYLTLIPLRLFLDYYLVKNSIAAYLAFLLIGFSETTLISACNLCIIPLWIAYSERNNRVVNIKLM